MAGTTAALASSVKAASARALRYFMISSLVYSNRVCPPSVRSSWLSGSCPELNVAMLHEPRAGVLGKVLAKVLGQVSTGSINVGSVSPVVFAGRIPLLQANAGGCDPGRL